MQYTVWYAGTLIGRTDLAMPSALSSIQVGQLVPAPGFVAAWAHIGPVMNEFMGASMAMVSPMSEIPHVPDDSPTERGQRVHDWLMAHPAGVRMRAAIEAVKTVGVAVRDATDQVIPAESIWIQETPLPDGVSMADMERKMAEAGVVGSFPFYMVSLTTKRDDAIAVR